MERGTTESCRVRGLLAMNNDSYEDLVQSQTMNLKTIYRHDNE